MRSAFLAPLLALALAGCGGTALDGLASRLLQRASGPVIGTGDAEFQRLIAEDAPRLVVWLLDRDIAASLLQAGARDGVIRWRAADNVQIYTRNGQIIGTRGLADDLMTAEDSGLSAALAGGGQITRIQRFLDGQDRITIRSYVCDLVPAGTETVRTGDTTTTTARRVDETCHSPGGDFTNHHWLLGGRILQTEQYLGAGIGRVRLLFLP